MNRDMKKEDAIKLCRYLNKNIAGDADVRLFVTCETIWVERMTDDDYSFADLLEDYFTAGLREFEQMDDTPITLKAVLFNRFCQYYDRIDVEAFRQFYERYVA